MLDDFQKTAAGTGRFGASLMASMLVYGSLGVGVVAASAVTRRAIEAEAQLEVAFAPEPPPPPPPVLPPPPPPAEAPRPAGPPARLGTPRPELEQPEEIPEETPEESDAPLPPPDPFAPEGEGDPNGTPDGVPGGEPGGTGTDLAVAPAPPAPEPVAPRGPVRVIEGSTPPAVDREELVQNFEIPNEVRTAGIARITVVVRVTIGTDGSVQRVDVLRGHALIPNENIIRAVQRSRFTPARMADGTAYAAIHTLPITLAITL